jgi:hypothetical protein
MTFSLWFDTSALRADLTCARTRLALSLVDKTTDDRVPVHERLPRQVAAAQGKP